MKRRMLSLLLVIALAVGMLPVFAVAETTEPTQDDNGVYQIGTPEQLLWFAQQVNSGKNTIKGKLTADIDMSGISDWPGIGAAPTYDDRGWMSDSSKSFAGSFDGHGHTVTLKNSEWGLFAYVMGTSSAAATVENVRIAGTVKRSAVAHEAGYAHFTGCINRATISSNAGYVAGIVGKVIGTTNAGNLYSDVRIINCGNETSITAGGGNVGGILGYSSTSTFLERCYNKGNVHGSYNIGGLVGYLQESQGSCYINNSYNTAAVTGSSTAGGIIGSMQNGVEVKNCYNAGSAAYAIAGARFNHTAVVTNSYFMGVKSAKTSPDYNETLLHSEKTKEIQTRAIAKPADYMATEEFAQLLSSYFKQSCPTPVLNWETAKAHTGTVCEHCAFGSEEKEVYDVSFETHNGYTLSGDSRVTEGDAYTFKIAISDGYEKAENFKVKVNGEPLDANSDQSYTFLNASGPLSITVVGVKIKEGILEIRLPADGYGYRAVGNKTVERGQNYTFTLSFLDGFSMTDNTQVIAQQILTQEELDAGKNPADYETVLIGQRTTSDKTYTYAIPNVEKNYRILVSGVKVIPTATPVTVNMTISEGYTQFHQSPVKGISMMNKELTVPYFDLSLYGLERYYFNEYCYVDANGNLQSQQKAGTPESAYNKITLMHAYIVATEIFRLGYSQDLAGTGASYQQNSSLFSNENPDAAISWTQGPGSSFMDFWEHGTNMNYYQNYVYPLGAPGWGSTSDQILIKNGDDITLHLITGQGSGSRFGVFTVNDTNSSFQQETARDEYTVAHGQKVKLTLYWTNTTGTYKTQYEKMKNKKLVWVPADYSLPDVSTWFRTYLGDTTTLEKDENGYWIMNDPAENESGLETTAMVTDSTGSIIIDTTGVEPGTYYIGALGGFTEGGGADQSGFVSTGAEAGVSVFKLTVEKYTGKLGDLNGDGKVRVADAALLYQAVNGNLSLTNEQRAAADVNGDGKVRVTDAALLYQKANGNLDKFPAE